MLLLRTIVSPPGDRDVWTAQTYMRAAPDQVLCALTDPAAIAQWAPVSFEVGGLSGGRLRPGARERVTGSLAGIRTAFDIQVSRADSRGLELEARGPVALDVAYRFRREDDGIVVEAAVSVRPQRGIAAQVLRGAIAALLNAGALKAALRRLEQSIGCASECELAAA